MLARIVVVTLTLTCCSLATQAADEHTASAVDSCLLEAIANADATATVGSIRTTCATTAATPDNGQNIGEPPAAQIPVTITEKHIAAEQQSYDAGIPITAFKPNYFLATYMTDPNEAPYAGQPTADELNNQEAKFQISIKAPVWRNMFGTNNDIVAAYTSTSWWQLGNEALSSAFRETNYEPEVFLRHNGDLGLPSDVFRYFDIGFNHQSNGRTELLSRSWNRIMGRALLDFDNVTVELRAWYRWPEDPDEDDNPRMYRYYGYGDVRVAYARRKNTFSALFRPGTEGNGLELTWSYPLSKIFRVYAQYWNGYGESLLDYDARIERFGIGVALNDYL